MDDKDYFEEIFEQSFTRLLWTGLGMLAGILVCVLLSGCGTQYVPVETVRTERVHTTDTIQQIDSIIRENNTVIKEADSATLAQLGIRLKDNERAILVLRQELDRERSRRRVATGDTVILNDTIRVPYPVERKLSTLELLGQSWHLMLSAAVIVPLLMAIIRWLRRRYKRN